VSAVLRTSNILLRDPTWVSAGYLVHLRLWLDRNDKLAIFLFNYMTRRLIDSLPLNYPCSYCHFHYTYIALRIFFYFIQHLYPAEIISLDKIVRGSECEKFFHAISPLSMHRQVAFIKVLKKYIALDVRKHCTWHMDTIIQATMNRMIIFYRCWFHHYDNI